MTTLILNVKGSADVATLAAERHGFEVLSAREIPSAHSTTLKVEGSLGVAAHWFCEPSVAVRGEGYPAGTLLLYR